MTPAIVPDGQRLLRGRRGRTNYNSGLAAEDSVARFYTARGARELARRLRTPHGEIDLIIREDSVLVFVEVKRRRSANAWDSPVSQAQWKRLECAALHYMLHHCSEMGVQPVCRFDVAIVDHAGRVQIVENARSCDEL